MSALEDPVSLLEWLRAHFGPAELVPPYGLAVIVPNNNFRREWGACLEKAGYHIFCGVHMGRVAWVIPVNRRGNNPGEKRFTGAITGRPWLPHEDQALEEAVRAGLSQRKISEEYASKLDRTPAAIRKRLHKLSQRRREKEAATSKPAPRQREKPVQRQPAGAQIDVRRITSMLEASLILAEDPRHLPAVRTLIETALKQLQAPSQG